MYGRMLEYVFETKKQMHTVDAHVIECLVCAVYSRSIAKIANLSPSMLTHRCLPNISRALRAI